MDSDKSYIRVHVVVDGEERLYLRTNFDPVDRLSFIDSVEKLHNRLREADLRKNKE